MESESNKYYYCFVPGCTSTSFSTPDKLFFSVSTGKQRLKWFKIAKREKGSLISGLKCCEDHFKLEEDVQDWTRFSVLQKANQKTFRLKLKKGVLPHIFDCQEDRERSHAASLRPVLEKRRKEAVPKDAFKSVEEAGPSKEQLPISSRNVGAELEPEIMDFDDPTFDDNVSVEPLSAKYPEVVIIESSKEQQEREIVQVPVLTNVLHKDMQDFSCQVRPQYCSKYVQTSDIPKKSVQTSPIKF